MCVPTRPALGPLRKEHRKQCHLRTESERGCHGRPLSRLSAGSSLASRSWRGRGAPPAKGRAAQLGRPPPKRGATTGKQIWSRKLAGNAKEGIDMAPQLYDDTVLFSTVPGNGLTSFYKGGARGVVWALDAATGRPKWTFDTIADGAKLWGNPKVNSGGGLWYPPAVDNQGRVFISVANPAPFPGTPKYPNRSSRP